MSNKWNTLSESINNKQKPLARVKVKRKSQIYKHIVLKKQSKSTPQPTKPDIEIKTDMPLSPVIENRRITHSFYSPKPKSQSPIFLFKRQSQEKLINYKETLLDINSLNGKFDLPSYLMNTRINLGKKLFDPMKIETLKNLSVYILKLDPDQTTFKYFFNDFERSYNVVCFGNSAPVSQCCKLNILVIVSKDFGGKLICPHKNCVVKCLKNFIISKEDRELLWDESEMEQKRKQSKSVNKKPEDMKGVSKSMGISSLYLQYKTLTTPKDTFSAFIGPIKQLFKGRKKIKH
ncbi:hypothetical protein SteCoe_32055 [Stentor coeruleus]|uniref:Uncharacterized protein n=1 Tax=Stentor coeruleus TaxID=5963 RepID=A0A1R2AZX9_9CILI|nr:hypothetical protein SteCoe_32055 [Stentor coeruleus]